MKYTLTRPVKFEGETVKEIDLDLNSLTGHDLITIQLQLSRENPDRLVLAQAYDPILAVYIAARASKKPLNFFDVIPMRDLAAIQTKVTVFFGSGDLEETQDANFDGPALALPSLSEQTR